MAKDRTVEQQAVDNGLVDQYDAGVSSTATIVPPPNFDDRLEYVQQVQAAIAPTKRPRHVNRMPHVIDFSKEDGSNTPSGRYSVKWGDEHRTLAAENANDAWARFCDHIQKWPSPKSMRTVEFLGN